ncbi:hypothetical protein JHK85_012450 [Glycine max]|nr:hypothetical protein JHK85_012450 [Glycine max]
MSQSIDTQGESSKMNDDEDNSHFMEPPYSETFQGTLSLVPLVEDTHESDIRDRGAHCDDGPPYQMECCHEEELRKLKADHNELEARVRLPKGDRHSTHTINEHTQGESHPRQTNNTLNDNNISHAHHHEGQTTQ